MTPLPTIKAPPSKATPAADAVTKYPMLETVMAPGWEERVAALPDARVDTSAARIVAEETLRFKSDPSSAEADACMSACIDLLAQMGDALAISKATKSLVDNFGLTKMIISQAIRQSFAENGAPDRFKKVLLATTDIYYDSTHKYYRRIEEGEWDCMASEQAKRHLKVGFSLADTLGDNDDYTEVDQALHHIETKNRVVAALPFPLWEDTVVTYNGEKFLNMCQARLVTPATGPHTWGQEFPWLADFLSGLFADVKNMEAFLAWVRQWYVKVRTNRGDGGRGMALFMVGPTGTGKTLLSRWVLGYIFGGYSDVVDTFVDGEGFNSNAFKHVVWCIDDAKNASSPAAVANFSSEVKRVVANPDYSYDAKFGYKGSVPFNGRFICSLNMGHDEMKLLPDVDMHMMDKVQLLRTSDRKCPSPNQKSIEGEIPHFLAWLEQSETPAWLQEPTEEMAKNGEKWRFGFQPYHDPVVLEEARSTAKSADTEEVIRIWMESMHGGELMKGKRGYDEKSKRWTGAASELLILLSAEERIRCLIPKSMGRVSLGRDIAKLMKAGRLPYVEKSRDSKGRNITIRF